MAARTNRPITLNQSPCTAMTGSGEEGPPDTDSICARDHPLLQDMWIAEDSPEYGNVRLKHIATVDRNLAAMETIARMLANNANEPDTTGGVKLNPWATTSLLGGIESLCSFSRMLTEEISSEVLRCAEKHKYNIHNTACDSL